MAAMVLLESHDPIQSSRSFLFSSPIREIVAVTAGQVRPALETVEREVAAGRHAAGFLCYEAASGLDTSLRVQAMAIPTMPLAWFGIFHDRVEVNPGSLGDDEHFSLSDWTPSVDSASYSETVERIRDYITGGDTYQVNFTFRQHATFQGSPLGFFRALCRSQRAGFCAYIETGRHRILSASPEMFFQLQGRELAARPMKGTMPRGRWWEEDDALAQALANCPKNRAENVMIVDLMRNDLGRVAEIGTVTVPRLYEVERYETVFQMTSTVRCRLRAGVGLPGIFAALFPSGSVTGAPKIRTMEIIEQLENGPRGIYTGAIGFVSPGPEAVFSVAIRTVLLDNESHRAEFGVGGGITYDSDADSEFQECQIKSRFLTASRPEFDLFETILYDGLAGYFILGRHLERLEHSARYFGFRFDRTEIMRALQKTADELGTGRFRARLVLRRGGHVAVAHAPFTPARPASLPKVSLASNPVESTDPFLFHKTTRREVYESRAQARPDCADVILMNERGEVTESTIANLVVALDGRLVTPPVQSGLLPGTFRAELLDCRRIAERTLYPTDLEQAEAIYLINSLRKWTRVKLVP